MKKYRLSIKVKEVKETRVTKEVTIDVPDVVRHFHGYARNAHKDAVSLTHFLREMGEIGRSDVVEEVLCKKIVTPEPPRCVICRNIFESDEKKRPFVMQKLFTGTALINGVEYSPLNGNYVCLSCFASFLLYVYDSGVTRTEPEHMREYLTAKGLLLAKR